MRIIYLHQYFVTPEMAGGSRSYEMARRLAAAGHDVHMVTSDQSAASSGRDWRVTVEAGINVHWIVVPYNNAMPNWRRILAFLTFAWRAARRASRLKGDVIFATSTPLTIAIPAVIASRRSGAPMVFEVRDLWPAVPIAIGAIRNPVARQAAIWLERFAYRNSSFVIALAPGMRDEIVATGYPAERITVIPNGCDLDVFSEPSETDGLRGRFKWLGDRPLIVFTGTFGLVNGTAYLAHLAEALVRIDPEIRIVAVGTGREFTKTQDLAEDIGVLNLNLFLLGQLPKIDAAAWVREADMTIALFTGPEIVWRDAVQNKFFDSLAAGTPVANNFPGWQSMIAKEAGAGIILSADNYEAAARDIAAAIRDQSWMESARTAARTLATRRFDRDSLALNLERVLEEACADAH